MKTIFSPHENTPWDRAVARFQCGMKHERMLQTPQEEIDLIGKRTTGPARLSSVYVIGNEVNSLVKIGYADNLASRFSGLQCGSPVALFIRHFVHVVDGLVAKRIEGDAHRLLAEHRRKGEWFDVPVSQAAAAIGRAILESGAKWWSEYERRAMGPAIQEHYRRYEERQRFFGT